MTRTSTKRRTRRAATPQQREAARRRDAELAQRAADALADPAIGAKVAGLLGCSARILGYSIRNQALLMDQAAERGIVLRDVDTFRGWLERGRCVRRGEQGLRIVRPVGVQDDKDDEDQDRTADETAEAATQEPSRPLFRSMTVFEISQTDGVEDTDSDEQADEDESPADAGQVLYASLVDQAEKAGYRVHHCTEHDMTDAVEIDHADHRVCLAEEPPAGREQLAELAAAVAEILTRKSTAPKPRQARGADQPLTLAVI